MAKAFTDWTVLEHGELVAAQSNLWHVEGAIPNMSLRRRMTVARLFDGTLLLHNPIALGPDGMAEVEALGNVAYIVVPNGWHRLDAANFRKRYPEAKILCPAGATKKVQQVVAVDGSYDDFPNDETVVLRHLEGLKRAEGVLLVVDGDRTTLVFNDTLFNLPHGGGVGGFFMRILGSSGGPKVTRIMRSFVVKDGKALRGQLESLAGTPNLCRIIPGHGNVIEEGAAAALREVAARL